MDAFLEGIRWLLGALTAVLAVLWAGMEKRISVLEKSHSASTVREDIAILKTRVEGLDERIDEMREEGKQGRTEIMAKLDVIARNGSAPTPAKRRR